MAADKEGESTATTASTEESIKSPESSYAADSTTTEATEPADGVEDAAATEKKSEPAKNKARNKKGKKGQDEKKADMTMPPPPTAPALETIDPEPEPVSAPDSSSSAVAEEVVASPTDLVADPPTLRPIITGLDLSQSQISPAKTEDAPSTVTSPTLDTSEKPEPDASATDRPTVPNRTISEGLQKKMTGTFSWLSRATTNIRKPSSSPTRNPTGHKSMASRRGTNTSVSTIGSMALDQYGQRKESLQDRFIALRLEEENHEAESGTITPIIDQTVRSPASESGLDKSPQSPLSHTGTRLRSPTVVDTKLPPGTAAGFAMGPSPEDDSSIDWDLWQQLVYEGPSVVNKTSGEDLSAAIQGGIPAPIRGVVWQVLADSKSETLEHVYRDLLGKDATRSPPLSNSETANPSKQINGTIKEESLASSASSIKSQSSSTPATSTNPTSPPPSDVNDSLQDDAQDQDAAPPPPPKKSATEYTVQVQKLEKQIRKDLGARTAYSKHLASAGLQEGLFGVCKAYALYDEDIGYAQGMNFIAMPLLFNMPEEEAFTLFVKLMSKYQMRSLFTPDMAGLHLRLYQFERLLEDYEPALSCHLHRRGVSPILYATPWFLTLFAYRFPLQLVQRIYDLVLTEGLTAIISFGLVLMRKNAQTLLSMKDMGQLTNFLKDKLFDVYIDKSPSASSILDSGFFGLAGGADKEVYHADALVRDACAVDIEPKVLSQYAAEYEEKAKQERDRETELDNLRTTNNKLSSQLRSVEARVQQQDNDHVGIASELIKTKVENQSLADDNESLRTQVDELRKVVEHQPAEVEARLKDEMDRIMSRNLEVQNSNRALEDQMQEMEQELVTTKLQHAQLNAEYEDLKQKLSSIQQMLGGGASGAMSPSSMK